MIKRIINFFSKEQDQTDEKFDIVYEPKKIDHHVVRIETTEKITESTARNHSELRSLFGAFNFEEKPIRIGFSNFEIHQFVSEELILQVEIKKLEK